MSGPIPAEMHIGQVLLPPILVTALAGLVATWLLTRILNRTRLARFFWHPALAFVALWVLMSALVSRFWIAP